MAVCRMLEFEVQTSLICNGLVMAAVSLEVGPPLFEPLPEASLLATRGIFNKLLIAAHPPTELARRKITSKRASKAAGSRRRWCGGLAGVGRTADGRCLALEA